MRGKKPQLQTKRRSVSSLKDVQQFKSAISFSKDELLYRQQNSFAPAPDHTNPDVIEYLEIALKDQNLPKYHRHVIRKFLKGHYNFGYFLEKEYKNAYIIYDALHQVEMVKMRERIETAKKNLVSEILQTQKEDRPVIPSFQDYRYFKGAEYILMDQEQRDLFDQLKELAEKGEMRTPEGDAIDLKLKLRGVLHVSCPALESLDRTNRVRRARAARA